MRATGAPGGIRWCHARAWPHGADFRTWKAAWTASASEG